MCVLVLFIAYACAQANGSMVSQYPTDLQVAVSHAANTCCTNKGREEDNCLQVNMDGKCF